jgi:LEA14-like dessication related protein
MRPFTRLSIVMAAPVLLAALAACGSSGNRSSAPPVPFDQPSVALRDVRLRGAGMTGGALDLQLRVYNPNDYDLEAPRVNYRVWLDTVQIAQGFADVDVTVPAGDSASVTVPATVGYAGLRRAGIALAGSGAAPYRVLGRITVGTPYGRLSFPYDRAGRFSTMNAALPR